MIGENDYLYYKKIAGSLSFPAAFVDMDLLDQNIASIRRASDPLPVRLATKSIRCRYLLNYIKEKLGTVAGLMTYHGEEALWLMEHFEEHLLVGYPVVDVGILEKAGSMIQTGKNISLMVDDKMHLDMLEALGRRLEATYSICLDIDLSLDFGPLHFGVWRSPVNDLDRLDVFLSHLSRARHLRLDGLMGYEAQIAGLGDRGQGIKSFLIRLLKRMAIPKIQRWRSAAVSHIRKSGHKPVFVNGGGTGSLVSTKAEEVVTEVTAGSGFFSPHLFDHYEDFRYYPAAFYASQIVRKPKPGIFTCHGGGYLASGGIDPLRAPIVHFPRGARLDINEGAGEVQTPVFYKGSTPLGIGDPIFFRHSKAGELCEHFNELHLIRNGVIERTVKTYRGESKHFL